MAVTTWDLGEAAATIRVNRDAVGEAVTRRTPNHAGGYVQSSIRAHLAPVPASLVSMGLYLISDLSFTSSSEVLQYDEIVRGGVVYYVLDSSYVMRLVDQVTGYRTVLRAGNRPMPW